MEYDSFVPIIRSLLCDVKNRDAIVREIESDNLLLETEKDWLQYIESTRKEIGILPTVSLLETHFPQLKSYHIHDVEPFDADTLLVYTRQFVNKRKENEFSKSLIDLSYTITQNGLSRSVLDKAYQLVTSYKEVSDEEYENPVDTFCGSYLERKRRPKGLKFYIGELDSEMGGLNYGTLNTIFGYTANFKTTLALNLFYNNITKDNYKLCLISLEMTKDEVITNLLGRHSRDQKFDKYPFISPKRIRETTLKEEEEDYLTNTIVEDFKQYKDKFVIYDQSDFSSLSELDIEYHLEKADQILGGMDAFILDHIGLLQFSGDARRDTREVVNSYVRFFQGQCVNFLHTGRTCTGIIIAQSNRDGYHRAIRNDGLYDLRAISDFNELERSSYRVISTYSDEGLKLSKEVRLAILKNRGGPTTPSPVSVYCEPEAYMIGDANGFSYMPSVTEFSSMFELGNLF